MRGIKNSKTNKKRDKNNCFYLVSVVHFQGLEPWAH